MPTFGSISSPAKLFSPKVLVHHFDLVYHEIKSDEHHFYYPDIKRAYNLSQRLSWIYEKTQDKTVARTRLALWIEKVRQSGFNTISNTINMHYENTLNYFDNRSLNVSAKSFNSKIKVFRTQF